MKRFRLWKEKNYTNRGYLYLHANNWHVHGKVGTDIKLSLWKRIQILFCGGISVVLHGKMY